MDFSQFENEYNLQQLELIIPQGHSFQMWVTPRFKNHFVDNSYEEFTSNIIENLAQNIDLFIDIGAHYGYYSLLVGQANPNCEIIAFEPAPTNYEILNKNIELNQLKNARAVNQAVSNKNEQVSFNISTASDNCAFIDQLATPTLKQINIQSIPLSELLSEKKGLRTLIRIDAEGHELKILEGFRKILSEAENIQMVLKINPECLLLDGTTLEELFTAITALGYKSYFLDEINHQYFQPSDNGVETWKTILGERKYLNIFCKKAISSTNLLFISHSSLLAGAERSLLELCKELFTDYGCMCTVVLPSHGPSEELLHKEGVATLIGPINWWCKGGDSASENEKNQNITESLSWLICNQPLFELINPDVILTNTIVIPWGAILASIIKKPHIWMIREYGKLDHGLNFFYSFEKILHFINESSDKIITNSKDVQNTLFPDHKPNKVETIYRFIDQPKIDNQNINIKSYFTNPESFHLIIPGSIMPSKGQDDAIRAVIELIKKRHYQAELILVGYDNPDYQKYLKELVENENVNDFVHIMPFMENINSLVQSSDIVLICSKKEAFGRVILEAMLMEKPIVATNSGGTKEMIIDGETGLLYEPGDYLQLADQIERMINDADLRNTLASKAKDYAKKTFTKEKFGGEYYKIIKELQISGYRDKSIWFQSLQISFLMRSSKIQISNYNQSIQSLNSLLAERDQSIQSLNSLLAERDQSIQSLNSLLAERDQSIQSLNSLLAERDQSIQSLNSLLAERDQSIQMLIFENVMYATSHSWLLTRPLRRIAQLFKRSKNA